MLAQVGSQHRSPLLSQCVTRYSSLTPTIQKAHRASFTDILLASLVKDSCPHPKHMFLSSGLRRLPEEIRELLAAATFLLKANPNDFDYHLCYC